MKEEFWKRLARLINVKSIITILLTIIVCFLAYQGRMDIEQIYLMIIAFYFGTQIEKKNGGNNNGDEEGK